jgi:hypothetical protein
VQLNDHGDQHHGPRPADYPEAAGPEDVGDDGIAPVTTRADSVLVKALARAFR